MKTVHNTTTSVFLAAIATALLISPSPAVAQEDGATETENASEETKAAEDASIETEAAPDAGESTGDQERRITELEQKLTDQQKAFEERLSALEEAREEDALDALPSGFEPSFDIFGFFDLTFNKFVPKKDGFYDGMLRRNTSFYMQNLNLYFKSEMTETLSTMVELRFSFMPNGKENSVEIAGLSEYDRVDTTVTDPFSSEKYRLNGVKIERVHLTWKPSEYFNVIAGRFLTPYGIWNVEHGTPILITIRPPYSQSINYLPLTQTGFQLFGDLHPGSNTRIHYAFTLSNGRGPMDEVYDLDNNKALGLRLRFIYDSASARFAFGGHGYMGNYTDSKRIIESMSPFDMDTEQTEKYREYIGSVDAVLEISGFKAQAEFIRRLVEYELRPLLPPEKYGGGYPADYVGTTGYLLLAYTLPLTKLIGQKYLTPYFLIEYVEMNDNTDQWGFLIAGGLNFKPSPFIVIKAEFYRSIFPQWHKDEVDEGTMDDPEEGFWE